MIGKVPVLEKDEKIVYESTVCNEYIDEVYPHERLTPSDAYTKARHQILMEVFDNVRSQCAVFKKVVQSFEQSGWFVLSAPNSYQITSFYSQMTGLFYKVRRPGEKHKAMEAISIALQPFEAEKGRMNGPYFGGEFLPTWPHDFDLVSSASLAFCHYFRRFSLSPRFSHLAMVRANGVHEGRWRQFDSPREVSQPEPLGRTHKGAARSQTHVLRAHITRSILRIIRSWISRL